MRNWLFKLLFRKELARLARLPHPEIHLLLGYTGPGAADFVLADLVLLARRSQQLTRELDQNARLDRALRSSNEQLLGLWARAYPHLPVATRAEFASLGRPEP